MQKTYAAIDVGSNAMRMIIARRSQPDQPPQPLESIRLPIRLGQDAFTQGHIGDSLLTAAADAFVHFRRVADAFEVTDLRAVATSALRESDNAETLIDRVYTASNIRIEVISGEEEARLVHLAITRSVSLANTRAMLIDIGGGSVEVTITQGEEIINAESYPLGTVRLLRKLADTGDNPNPRLLRDFTEAIRGRVRREIAGKPIQLVVGTGGNIEELGALAQRLFKSASAQELSASDLKKLLGLFEGLTPAQRAENFNLRSDRADVILPAAVVLYTLLKLTPVKAVTIPNVGLKDGVLIDLAANGASSGLPRDQVVINSALRLGERFFYDAPHALAVEKLSMKIFDQTLTLHRLNEKDRVILRVATLLHDVGHFINTIDHDKHGYYILQNVPLLGFSPEEQHLAAVIVRIHRKGRVPSNDDAFKNLGLEDRQRALKSCAILRLADALETGRSGRLADIELIQSGPRSMTLILYGEGDFLLETWSLNKRKGLFEEVFGVSLDAQPVRR